MGIDIRQRTEGKSLVEIEYHDPARGTEYLEGIHQILMLSEDHLVLTHGAETANIPYGIIKQITVRFKP